MTKGAKPTEIRDAELAQANGGTAYSPDDPIFYGKEEKTPRSAALTRDTKPLAEQPFGG